MRKIDLLLFKITLTPRWKVFVPSIKWQFLRGNMHFPHSWLFWILGGETINFDKKQQKKKLHNLFLDLIYLRWKVRYSIFDFCRNYYFCPTSFILEKVFFCTFLAFFLMLVKVHENYRFRTCSWNRTKKSRKFAGFKVVFSSYVLRTRKIKCSLTSMII